MFQSTVWVTVWAPVRTSALALALTFGLSLTTHATPLQDGAEVERLLDERIQALGELPVAELFEQASQLAQAAKAVGTASFDHRLDQLLARSNALSERAQLFVISARLQGDEPDRGPLAVRLIELLSSKDEELGRAAASVLCDTRFRELKDKEEQALVDRLRLGAQDANHSPAYRLECAVGLYIHGRGDGQRDARKEMIDCLGSSDIKLKNQGALALARVGDIDTGRTELERLRASPGEEGRLAEAYLKQDDIRRLYDRKQKKLFEQQKEGIAGTKGRAPDDLLLIEKVIKLIESASLEGDQHQRDELISSALDGMLRSLDEHSSYMTPKVFKEFDQELLAPEYGGIGAYVSEDPDDRLFTITRPIYSGPAYRAGLHSDDKIVRIDDWPTIGPSGSQPTDEIIKHLKGKPGTSVKLYVWRRGMDPALVDRPTEEMAVTVQREQITIPPVQMQMLPGDIGLVELSTFSRVASEELQEKLKALQAKGMRGVILDLRNDTGGLLSEAGKVANLFLPKKKLVVRTESRVEDPERLYTTEDPLIPDKMPVAVLINRFSASASEIVAGALQDYARATLVGQRSFGKGSVQQLLKVPGEDDDQYADENHNEHHDSWEKLTKDQNGNGEFDYAPRVRMTIARYLLPSGRSIHRELDATGRVTSEGGVEPDEAVAPRRFETWKLEEFIRLQKERRVREWVERNYTANRALFQKLADGDDDDTTQYPGFDDFYNSLGTVLTAQDVRFLLRREIRRRVQDDRGAAFPEGDYQEDPMLQRAIEVVLEKLGTSYKAIPSYAHTFELPTGRKDAQAGRMLTANMSDTTRSDLKHALSLIDEARSGGGSLSPERLAELEKVLQSVLDK